MLVFPNAKINLGLNIVRKRNDGYHDLETIFYPIQLSDILEVVIADQFTFTQTGITIDAAIESNLVVKAYRLLEKEFKLSPVHIHLHKIIPMGAGLGGGSSDAAFALKLLNELFQLELSVAELQNYAIQLGSDCPFFILNQPVFAEGKGEIFSRLDISLKGFHLLLVKPDIHVPTAKAYEKVIPHASTFDLKKIASLHPDSWQDQMKNDFETSVFSNYPEIERIKVKLKDMGAVYASMSGSGSSVFGIFEKEPEELPEEFKRHFIWQENIQ